ncbi:hypothetical protein GO755_29225 [Spirosoma sp. HMF4905]|uniref:PNPLA domain-containing protein n=1 Tax=Spirosoma arboris TaxID=2682092 RepID=A0A7K1SK16_9BACT|nr:tetratricopeptide repeat-containing protein [Spirosoma arboris]MVM34151.1 hypothetical protein [Spirosoma arboris]
MDAIKEARSFLNLDGQLSTPALTARKALELAQQLSNKRALSYARRVLEKARKLPGLLPEVQLKLDQKCAVSTYKDPDLPLLKRLDQALAILVEDSPKLSSTTENSETLGIAGAIYKRKWESDGQVQNLETSLAYYQRGFDSYMTGKPEYDDWGYTGVNAAFMLDLLIQQESQEAQPKGVTPERSVLQKKASGIREALKEKLTVGHTPETTTDYWYLVTVAEVYFGLQEYTTARSWLERAYTFIQEKKGTQDAIPDWQVETTARQLAKLAVLHENSVEQAQVSEAWTVLRAFTKVEPEALQAIFNGKTGLALSGGGFRASLYHIGVLAKLAELDKLRHIEVLSCVSGGSIIGAYYYLKAKNLLESVPDSAITRECYIELVKDIERDFLAGVQRNIRTRVLADFGSNLKMLIDRNYSRTERVGELYEQELFAKINDTDRYADCSNGNKKGLSGDRQSINTDNKPIWLNELLVKPIDDDGKPIESFSIKSDNWRRQAKVPMLILNATTLNTGHNWQFTASWMGESPAAIQQIDGNYRLRRMYYKPEVGRSIRLGHAVAASSCVPGLFEPLARKDLYEHKIVRLVDGGVHDNQGICGLLEQDCSVLLVSDASGQMSSEDDPSSSILGVPPRTNDVLMERIRNAQYQDLLSLKRAGLLKELMFIHLKMDLDVIPVDWINCEDPSPVNPNLDPFTSYTIRKDMQARLSAIRTDLDSFHDTEAFSLMTSGYLMVHSTYCKDKPVSSSWKFLQIKNNLTSKETNPELKQLLDILDVSREKFMKVWMLSEPLQLARKILLAGLLVGLIAIGFAIYQAGALSTIVSAIGWVIIALASILVIRAIAGKLLNYKGAITRIILGLGLITIGWIVSNLHLLFFDKLYLRKGKVN